MSNTNKTDINELYGLFTQWAILLPKEGQKSNSVDMHSIGNKIKQLCGILENSPTPSLAEVKKEPEADFKPTFIFQLTSDEVINPDKTQFSCVYDFCQELKSYCENSTKNLSIEKDWLKLLLACSSHNYERFMWIHLTFQSLNNLKLTWNQVQKRLQSKFDEPTRPLKLKDQIYAFQYIPEIETIEEAYKRFKRLADEVQNDIRENYVNSLPEKIKEVMRSTMAFDDSKNFHYSLDDIQQRAVVFINANSEDFIFFSKDAHVALNLNHEKVNKSDCEFHLLAEHSTLTCPDHIILRYPYMDFTCMTVNNSPIQNTHLLAASSQVQAPPPAAAETVQKTTTMAPDPVSIPTRQEHKEPTIKQEAVSVPAANHKTVTETVTTLPAANVPKISAAINTAVGQEKVDKEFSMARASVLDRNKLLLNRGKELQDVKPPSRKIPIVKATSSRSEGSSSASKRSSSPKRKRSRSRSMSPRRRRAHSRSISPVPHYGSSSRSLSSSSRHTRHKSPKREETIDEIGCYIHGLDSSHTTKECHQAQMVIPVRSISPPLTPPIKSRRGRNRSEPGEENICIFCGLTFKPGHLGYCKEVYPKKSSGRGRYN